MRLEQPQMPFEAAASTSEQARIRGAAANAFEESCKYVWVAVDSYQGAHLCAPQSTPNFTRLQAPPKRRSVQATRYS